MDIPRQWKRDVDKWVNKGGKFPLKSSIEMSGMAGNKLGTRSVARWADEIQKIMSGQNPPSGFQEWKNLFIYGHSKPVGTTRGTHSDPMGLGNRGAYRAKNRYGY